ncbi:unnamed protein product [Ectocarpus fasciculatus]
MFEKWKLLVSDIRVSLGGAAATALNIASLVSDDCARSARCAIGNLSLGDAASRAGVGRGADCCAGSGCFRDPAGAVYIIFSLVGEGQGLGGFKQCDKQWGRERSGAQQQSRDIGIRGGQQQRQTCGEGRISSSSSS